MKKRGRTENLKQWKPGQSGNPGGRPKTASLSRAYRNKLEELVPGDAEGRTFAQAIADVLADKALRGDIRCAQELADRAEGRSRQALEIEHRYGELKDAFNQMTQEELKDYAERGVLPEWFPRSDNDEPSVQ